MLPAKTITSGSLAAWKIAFRPHTLWLTAVPVAVGAALVFALQHELHWPTLVLAFLCAIMIQVITNLQNDVGYTDRGIETGARIGFPRATQNGWLTARQIRTALCICVGITVLLGLPLVIWHGWIILVLGVLSIIAAILYMAGIRPIAFTPWGEVAVFIFFGLIAVNGTVYLLMHSLPWLAWPVACATGLLAAAVLLVNNYRDIEHDKNTGRRTLPVALGLSGARFCYAAMIFLPFVLLGALTAFSPWFLLPMLALPFAWRTWQAFKGNTDLIGERDEAQGARSAATETYQDDRRGCEHRATQRFARAAIESAFPNATPSGLAFNEVMLRTVRLEALYGGLFVVAGVLAGMVII